MQNINSQVVKWISAAFIAATVALSAAWAAEDQACGDVANWTLASFEDELMRGLIPARQRQDRALQMQRRKLERLVAAGVLTEQEKNDFAKNLSSLPEYATLEQQNRKNLEDLLRVRTALQDLDRQKLRQGVDPARLCAHVSETRRLTRETFKVVEDQIALMDTRIGEIAAAANKSNLLAGAEQELDSDIAEQRKQFQRIASCTLLGLFGMKLGNQVSRDGLSPEAGWRLGTYGFTFKPERAYPPFESFRGYAMDELNVLDRIDGSLEADTVERARAVVKDVKADFEKTHQCRFDDYSIVAADLIPNAKTKDLELRVAVGTMNGVVILRDGASVGVRAELRPDHREEILRRGK